MKQAKDIMTTNPACCMPENSVEEAAQMMVAATQRPFDLEIALHHAHFVERRR